MKTIYKACVLWYLAKKVVRYKNSIEDSQILSLTSLERQIYELMKEDQ